MLTALLLDLDVWAKMNGLDSRIYEEGNDMYNITIVSSNFTCVIRDACDEPYSTIFIGANEPIIANNFLEIIRFLETAIKKDYFVCYKSVAIFDREIVTRFATKSTACEWIEGINGYVIPMVIQCKKG